jgi:PAS domain S-box-containing protein
MNPIVDELLLKKHDPLSEQFEYLEELIAGQAKILEMISKGDDLMVILNQIIRWAETESREGLIASILLTNYNGERLLHGAAPSLPEDYNNAIHGIAIGPTVGSCGTAAYTKKQVIVEDITVDPLWADFRSLAISYGLRACWSTPLMSKDGSVLGTFAMYYKQPKKPTAHDLQIIKLISYTTVIAIEWTRSAEEKKLLAEKEKQDSQKLRSEWQDFYNMLMNAPAMVAVLRGPEHVFEVANPMYMKAVGVQRQVLGKSVKDALPEVVEQGFINILDQVYQTGKPFYGNEVAIKLARKETGELDDGYFNFTYQPIQRTDGSVEGIFVHAVDVTELTLARRRAEESEQRFRSFVLNAPTPIGIYVGREMRIQTANNAILKAWEKDKSVVGKTFREALPELEGQPFYDILDKVYTTGVPYEAKEELVYLMRDEKLSPTYWNFSYTPLRNVQDEIYGVMNTATEVTELVNAKKDLLQAQDALRSAVEIGGLGTWSVNLTSNFVTYDKPIVHWFGLPEEGTTLDEVVNRIHENDRQKVGERIQEVLNTLGIYEAEYRVVNPLNGRERILYAKGRVVTDESGKAIFLNGINRDITLQRETEKQLNKKVELRTLELQNANAELNNLNENLKQFVYVASHDLQEPLRKINMFSDLLQERSGTLDEQQQNYLGKITKAARRMAALIKDLLDFSRAESKEQVLSATDLNQVVSNVIEDYEVLIQQKNAVVKVGDLPVLNAIPLQMNQLFYNLIGNALKFSKPGVPPEIAISCEKLSTEEITKYEKLTPGNYLQIIVADNGIGFDQKFSEQIFVIFQRLHGKNEYDGTGIGLALCKKIAENHKGIIYAESKENNGAEFHVILPC